MRFDNSTPLTTTDARPASAEHLLQSVKEITNKPCYNDDSILNAFDNALRNATPADRVVVFGSFLTVAAVQPLLT